MRFCQRKLTAHSHDMLMNSLEMTLGCIVVMNIKALKTAISLSCVCECSAICYRKLSSSSSFSFRLVSLSLTKSANQIHKNQRKTFTLNSRSTYDFLTACSLMPQRHKTNSPLFIIAITYICTHSRGFPSLTHSLLPANLFHIIFFQHNLKQRAKKNIYLYGE